MVVKVHVQVNFHQATCSKQFMSYSQYCGGERETEEQKKINFKNDKKTTTTQKIHDDYRNNCNDYCN